MKNRFLANALTALLVLTTVIGLTALAIDRRALDQDRLKGALAASGAYGTVAPAVLAQYEGTTVAGISSDDSAVRQAATGAFSASYVQQAVEPAIDDTFMWLQGNKARPAFSVDYKDGLRDFGRRLGGSLAERLASLPVCSVSQTLQLGSEARDILSSPDGINRLTCRPAGITQQAVAAAVGQYFASGRVTDTGPLSQTAYKAQDVRVDGQPFYEQARIRQLPAVFQAVRLLPWLSVGLGIILLIGIYALSRSRHKTVLRLAVSAIISGLAVCIVAVEAAPAARFLLGMAPSAGAYEVVVQKLAGAVTTLAGQTGSLLQAYGLAAILIGAVLLIFLQWRTWQRLPAKKPGHKPGTV